MHWSENYRPENLETYLANHKPPLLEPAYATDLAPRVSIQSGNRIKIGWQDAGNGSIAITHNNTEPAPSATESTRPLRKPNGLLRSLGKKLSGRTVTWEES